MYRQTTNFVRGNFSLEKNVKKFYFISQIQNIMYILQQ